MGAAGLKINLAEIIEVLNDLYSAAVEAGLDDIAKRIAENIAVFTEAMKREATRKQKLLKRRARRRQ